LEAPQLKNAPQLKPPEEAQPEKLKLRKPKTRPKEASPENEVINLKRHFKEDNALMEKVSNRYFFFIKLSFW